MTEGTAQERGPETELIVVMPVYNEQASIRKVVSEWFAEIENWTDHFTLLVINDGSTDQTAELLARLQKQLGPHLEVINQPNQGHGQSCLNGYRIALQRRAPFVFQIDSDGQCDPQYFFRFWRLREKCDVVYGRRARRDDGWRRVLASAILKATVLLFAGVYCVDANVPYRLMRTEILEQPLRQIPRSFFLANVAMAVLLRRRNEVRHLAVPIHFRERYGGEPSVRIGKFGEKAIELIRQLRALE